MLRVTTEKMTSTQEQSRDEIYAALENHLHGFVVELCKSHLQSYADDGEIWLAFAQALSRFFRFDEAEEALDRAFALCAPPLHAFIFSERGHLDSSRGAYLRAEQWFLKAIEANPQAVHGRVFLGAVAFKRGDLKLAEKRLREAVECGGDEIDEAYFNLGGVLMAQERYEDAAQCYRRAIELDPQYKQAAERLRDVKKILARATTTSSN